MATYRAVQPYQFRGEIVPAGTEITTENEADEREAQLGVRFGKLAIDKPNEPDASAKAPAAAAKSPPPSAAQAATQAPAARTAGSNPVAPMTSQDGPGSGSRAIPRR